MATETLYATSLTAGAVASSGNALGAPNGTWTTDTGNINWTARFAMGNPVGAQANGTHSITVTARKEPGQSNNPTISSITLYSGTFSLGAIGAGNWTISSTVGQSVTATFNAGTLLSGLALGDIEVEVATVGAGGSPSARASVQIDAITWSGDFTTASPPSHSGSVALSGDGTLGASGSSGGQPVPIEFVGVATADYTSTTPTAQAVPLPSGWQAGDLILLFVPQGVASNSTTVTWPGATQVGNALGGSDQFTSLWWKIAGASESPTWSTSDGSSRSSVVTAAYRGVDSTTPIDTTVGFTDSPAGATHTIPSQTVTNGAWLVSLASLDGSAGTAQPQFTHPSGWTERVDYLNNTADNYASALADTGPLSAGVQSGHVWGTAYTDRAVNVTVVALRSAPGGGGNSGTLALSGAGTLSVSGSAGGGGGGGGQVTIGNTQNATSDAGAGTVTKPTGLADGHVLYAFCGTSALNATPPSGFTVIGRAQTTATQEVTVARKVVSSAASEPASYTWTGASGRTSLSITAMSGVDPTTQEDVAATTASGSGSVSLSTTTATANALVVAAAIGNWSTDGMTVPPSMTELFNLGNPGRRTAGATLVQASAGSTGTLTFTGSSGLSMGGIIFAVKPAPGGGPGGDTGSIALSGSGALSLSGSPGGAPAETVVNLWVGGIATDAVTVAARVTGGGNATLVVSTNSDLSSPITGSPAAISNGLVKVSASGLTAGTTYYYGISIDGELDAVRTGTFRTAPSGAANFSFVFGSCATTGSNSDAFTRALARDPDLCFITGDLHYENPGTATEFHTGIDTQLGDTFGDVAANVPTSYTWSDHDWSSDNNGGASSAMNSTANSIYRQRVPSHTLPPTTGIYHTFTYGRVRFIVTDERSFKSDNSATDNSSKTMLGATQKQWFKDQITNSTEPVIFWVGDTPWNGAAASPDDEWFAYNTERQELATFFQSSGKNIIRVCGDMHALAADDGTNSPGGIPILHAAPLNNAYSNKAGPYTSGPYPTTGSNIRQYGVVTVTDDGTDITVTYAGYDTSDIQRTSWTDTYATTVSASGTLALSGSGALTSSGTASASGSVVLSGSGTLDSSATVATTGSVATTGEGALATTGTPTPSGTLGLSGAGTQVRAGDALTASGTLGAAGEGTQTRQGSFTITGDLSLDGEGTLTSDGTPAASADLDLSGDGSLDFDGSTDSAGTLALSGDGQVAASGVIEVTGHADLSGAGSLGTDATLATTGEVATSGSGSTFLGGDGAASGSIDLSGAGQVTASGSVTAAGDLDLLGNGVLSNAGEGSEQHNGSVDLSGGGQVTSEGAPSVSESLELGGDGTLDTTARPSTGGEMPLSGSGSVTAAGSPAASGSVATAGSGTLLPGGSGTSGGALNLSGGGQMAADSTGATAEGALDLSGGSIVIFGSNVAGSVALTGAGEMLPVATRVTSVGAIDLAGAGEGLWEGSPRFTATVALSGTGQVALSGSISAVAVLNLTGDGILRVTDVLVATDGIIDLAGGSSLDAYAGEPPFYPDLQAVILAPVVRAAILSDSVTATIELDTAKAVVVTQTEVTQ